MSSKLKIISVFGTFLAISCGGGSSGKKSVVIEPVSCVGSVCPIPDTCGSESTLVDGVCQPKAKTCAEGQILQDGSCVDVPGCEEGTVLMFDECVAVPLTCEGDLVLVNGACVAKPVECSEGFTLVNNRCEANTPAPAPAPNPLPAPTPNPGPTPSTDPVSTPDPAPSPAADPLPTPDTSCPAGSSLVNGSCAPIDPPPSCAAGETLVNGACKKIPPVVCPIGQTLAYGFCSTSDPVEFRYRTLGTVSIEEMKAVKARFKAVFDALNSHGFGFNAPFEIKISDETNVAASEAVQLTTSWMATVSKNVSVADIQSLISSQGLLSTNGLDVRFRTKGQVNLAEVITVRDRLALAVKSFTATSYTYTLPYEIVIQEQASVGKLFSITQLSVSWLVRVAKDATIDVFQKAIASQGLQAIDGRKLSIRSSGEVPLSTLHAIRSRFDNMIKAFELAKYPSTIPFEIIVSETAVEDSYKITNLSVSWNVRVSPDVSDASIQAMLIRQGIQGTEGHKLRFRGQGRVNLGQIIKLNLLMNAATAKLDADRITYTLPYELTVRETLAPEGAVKVTQLTVGWMATIYHGLNLNDIESMVLSQGVQ